jgi:hypothetical protein
MHVCAPSKPEKWQTKPEPGPDKFVLAASNLFYTALTGFDEVRIVRSCARKGTVLR